MPKFTEIQREIMDLLDLWILEERPRYVEKGDRAYMALVEGVERFVQKKGEIHGAHPRGKSGEVQKTDERPVVPG